MAEAREGYLWLNSGLVYTYDPGKCRGEYDGLVDCSCLISFDVSRGGSMGVVARIE